MTAEAAATPTIPDTPGLRPTLPLAEERWGGFLLTPDPRSASVSVESRGARVDFPWDHESLWGHRFGKQLRTEAESRQDSHIPWPRYVPSGEHFLMATVLDDGRGAADGAIAFLASDHPDVRRYAPRGERNGDDATLVISWSRRFSQPVVLESHVDPIGISGLPLAQARVQETSVSKVEIGGNQGVMRLWSPRADDQSMYGGRLPTVLLNWFEGGVLWSVQSYFLSPDEVLRVAESIGPVTTE